MTLFYEKRRAIVIFTVHNLNLTDLAPDSSFQVEWKRGKNKGFTEKMFPQENTVHFEKQFRFNATFSFSKDGKCKQKLLSIKVLRFKDKTSTKNPKIFGKAIVDLSMYQKFESALSSTFTLESKHMKKATIMVTTQIKFIQSKSEIKEKLDTENTEELSSMSTAQMLSSDHVSSWDVSSIINPSDSSLISSKSEKMKSQRLNSPEKNDDSHKVLKSCIADDDQRIDMMKKRKRSNSLKKKQADALPKQNISSSGEMEQVKTQLNNFFSPQNPSSIDQKKMKKSKKMSEMYLSYQVSLGLIKATLNYPWCDSPVPIVCKDDNQEQISNENVNDETDKNITNSPEKKQENSKENNKDKADKNTTKQSKKKTKNSKENKKDKTDKNITKSNEKKQENSKENKKDKTDKNTIKQSEKKLENSKDSIIPIENIQSSPKLVSYPKPSSAIFAAILHTQFLQKNVYGGVYFDSILDTFYKTIESHKYVKNCTPVDTFTVFVHLLALLEKETIRIDSNYIPKNKTDQTKNDGQKDNNYVGHLASTMKNYTYYEIDKDRFFLFYSRFSNITIDSFSHLCEHLVDTFAPYIDGIFQPKFDPNYVIEGFSKCFKDIESRRSVEKETLAIAEDYISEITDSKLVDYLIKNPKCCTLSNSIEWNYLITSLEAEVPLSKLTLFKEASLVIMMSKNICESPVECDEIAPHLPKIIVYTILKNLSSCQYMPVLPNPSIFFSYYKSEIASAYLDSLYASDNYLTTSDKMTVTDINERNIVLPNEFVTPKFERFEDIIASINTSNWKDIQFTEKEQNSFSFIETIFNNGSN